MPRRGPKISATVKKLVRYTALKDKRPRRVVAIDLQKQIETIQEPIPEVETLERMISSMRNQALDEEDNGWHLSTIVQYPMPFEALPIVLKVWADAVEQNRPFTIREALWVARLYHVFKDAGQIDNIRLLTEIATDYSSFEKEAKLSEQTAENKRDIKFHWFVDAKLIKVLYKDERPMAKVLSEIKWRKLTDEEAQEAGLPELFRSVMEASDERPYNQKVQE